MAKKIIRAATIGMSLNIFCKGLLKELKEEVDYFRKGGEVG